MGGTTRVSLEQGLVISWTYHGGVRAAGPETSVALSRRIIITGFLHFFIYIRHTRPDPITKRISAVPPFKWRHVSHICLPIYLLKNIPLNRRGGQGGIAGYE